jgi:hypothetical protein
MKIIYTIKRHTNQVMPRMHRDLVKMYPDIKKVLVTADYEKMQIEVEYQDKALFDEAVKDTSACFGISRLLISAFVTIKIIGGDSK